MPEIKPTNETKSGHPHSGQAVSYTTSQATSYTTSEVTALKKVNEVQRIVHRNSSIYTRDLVGSLIEKIRMLQKQKKFLQTKLREACNGSKSSDN